MALNILSGQKISTEEANIAKSRIWSWSLQSNTQMGINVIHVYHERKCSGNPFQPVALLFQIYLLPIMRLWQFKFALEEN